MEQRSKNWKSVKPSETSNYASLTEFVASSSSVIATKAPKIQPKEVLKNMNEQVSLKDTLPAVQVTESPFSWIYSSILVLNLVQKKAAALRARNLEIVSLSVC